MTDGSAREATQRFPTTHATWVHDARSDDDAVLARLAARIIERYAQPLEACAQGSSLREIAEPRELVQGFLVAKFASADATRAYLAAWNASGLTLRRWMMNGLLLHARGVTARLRTRLHELLDEEGLPGNEGVDEIVRLLT